MKWFDAFKEKPRKGAYIWVWNSISQKQEMFIVNPEVEWEEIRIPQFPIWSYVFESDFHDQPERLKRSDAGMRSDSTELDEYMKVESSQK